jgi:hypothetical protein
MKLYLIAVLALSAASLADILVIDNTRPVVLIERPTTASPAYVLENITVNITFNYTEANPSNYTITIFNSTIVVCSKFVNTSLFGGTNITINDTCTLSGARNNYNFSVRVNMTDLLGNTSSNTQTDAVVLDNVAPVVSGEQPANNSEVSASTVTFSVNTSETAECRYGQQSGMNFDSMTTFANTNSTEHSSVLSLSEFGTYNFYVRCKDPSDNRNPDYYTRFYYVGSNAYFGRSVGMSFGLKLVNKSDDTIKRSADYAIAYDNNGTVFAVVQSGSRAFSSDENRSYTVTDYLLTLTQSAPDNRFVIAYTKGDDTTIKGTALGGGKIPSRTFYRYAGTKPQIFKIYIILQYMDVHLTGKQSWRGAGKLLVKNSGTADDGLKNITIEVL